ncbi:Uncharacterised protein [Sphingobacterium daejeonense]|nr:Uncharacterised protein [Sphingobacterium daejeonense]
MKGIKVRNLDKRHKTQDKRHKTVDKDNKIR